MLGQFDVKFFQAIPNAKPSFKNGFKKVTLKEIHSINWKSKIVALQEADVYIFNNFTEQVGLIKQNAGWRKDTPSEKQITLLKRFWFLNVENLSKWEACNLLSKYFADKEAKKKSKV